ncbi:hypothetical protein [Capnocytophaga catalasegens]|uniref:hypothetical protein n=1 Tax=Capnocytophaga catalasegens TaxID=1004260 RepID=UPI00222EFCD8|nr:hypothetical protein [Capnocytophaga catalasegens]GIZ15762.1 hypothetical protein RCZ03_17620 [Capnocytophaga catalasegens]
MLKSAKNEATIVNNSSEAVQTEKFIESTDKACLVRTEEARKRYLTSLREAYAQKLFSKFMNELSAFYFFKISYKNIW